LKPINVSLVAARCCCISTPEPFGNFRRHKGDTPDGGQLVKRIIKSLPVSIAVAVLVSVAAAGCATAASGPSPKSASDAQAGFAGYKWLVVTIDHGGKATPVPTRYAVYLQFAPDGQFGAHEPVNYHGGTYHQTGDGFTTSGMVSTAVGYAGHDPVVLLSVGAISAFDNGVHAEVRLTGDRLAVTVGGYRLTCQRDGRQADFPPARPT
jgi:heat shock protein HslJ